MGNILIQKVDETRIYLKSDDHGALMELSEYFTFYADGYKFAPSYRNKMWDGKIRIFDSRNHTLPYGLLIDAVKFLKSRGYGVSFDSSVIPKCLADKKDLHDIAIARDIRSSSGERIHPRDYQISAYSHGLTEGRSLIVSPTGSGKSLIIYLMLRWYLENHDGKILIIVPTTSLVEQMYKDFGDYSSHDSSFQIVDEIHRIYSGKEKISDHCIVVTTWQSAITLPKSWFKDFGMVIGDEAHLFKAKSLNTIMGNLTNACYRIGTTGTLDGSLCNERVLIGNFGPVHKVITTKELIDNNTLAKLSIQCLVLNYPDEHKKIVSKLEYQQEIDAIVTHDGRNAFISNLAVAQNGNTLVLFNLVNKHGKPLYERIKATVKNDRCIFYVSGEVGATAREEIRALTEKQSDAIIVASAGTFATGINIKNLNNIIFAAPTKSQIRVLQSIGRGLRKSDDGRPTVVYDISDNFSWKKKKNYTMQHAIDRIKIYAKEGFTYKIDEVQMS